MYAKRAAVFVMLFCGSDGSDGAGCVALIQRLYPAISARKGTIVNRYLLAVALGFVVGGAAHAAVIDVTPPGAGDAGVQPRVADLAVNARQDIVTAPVHMSELPEPEVFAMMLVGLVLLGYRARRDSNEKFK